MSTFGIVVLIAKVWLARLGFRCRLSEQEADYLLHASMDDPELRSIVEELLAIRR